MTKIYRKNELTFAILWIVAYVVLSSLADQLSESIGVVKSVTVVLHVGLSLILFIWIRKNDLFEKYGFCASGIPAKRFLYYLPLVIIASASLWGGVGLRYGLAGTVCYVISMCCVGFLEEVIFRGLLFRAMEKDGLKTAILVSSLTFGIGHIVNLLAGQANLETVIQVLFAIAWGFIFTMVYLKSGSLLPCIIAHGLVDAFSKFSDESITMAWVYMIATIIFAVVYCFYLSKLPNNLFWTYSS